MQTVYTCYYKMKDTEKELLIVATTFPRWKNDAVPSFVLDHAKNLSKYFKKITVVVPHYKNSKTNELVGDIHVKRFRYFFPASAENIVYEGHATSKIKKSLIYAIKLLLFVMFQFLSIVINGRNKIVNAHWLIPQGFLAILAKPLNRSKVIISVHGGDVYALRGRMMNSIKKFTLKHADEVIVNSSSTRKVCREIYKERTYPIIPMGVDVERFKKSKNSNKNRMFTVTFVGRLSSQKGVIDVLASARKIKADGIDDIQFNIAGDGPQKEKLLKYVQGNQLGDIVSFLGWLQPKELPSLLKKSDVFIGPSVIDDDGWTEAFGLVFVEAAAAGLPVITTNVGGIKDIVDDAITGFLVDQKSPDQLADKIVMLKNNEKLRIKMSKAAVEKSDAFSWDKSSSNYYEILKNI